MNWSRIAKLLDSPCPLQHSRIRLSCTFGLPRKASYDARSPMLDKPLRFGLASFLAYLPRDLFFDDGRLEAGC